MSPSIAFVTYESPFAPSGGIAAVMSRLPEAVSRASRLPTYVFTPFHSRIAKTTSLKGEMTSLGKILVPYGEETISVNINLLERAVNWCFLEAEDERFFAGLRHPYDLSTQPDQLSKNLRRDSLFFGWAVARSLPLVSSDSPWLVLMQDWEGATTALALADQPEKDYRLFLTIHNSYDTGVSDSELQRFAIKPKKSPGNTILQRALSLVRKPVFTVSDQFARDFRSETLQSAVLAPHLKSSLTGILIGVNNGIFTELAIDQETLHRAKRGDFELLRQWKAANRAQALISLDEFTPSEEKPIWGDLKRFKRDGTPWFVVAGRDDPRQKGYDVACLGVADFLSSGGNARFLFFPIPGDEGLAGLTFLKKLARKFPESVLVFPFIFQEAYFSVLQAATYGLMPSLYEPFGMANEFYLKGTVGIGRATGGIIQQIVPLRSASAFSHAVQARSDHYYGTSAAPTGILFRERDEIPSAVSDWLAINAAEYDRSGKRGPDRVEQRASLPLFQAIARELRLAIEDGVRIYDYPSGLYYEMLTEGINYIQRTFSWERSAQAYLRYIVD